MPTLEPERELLEAAGDELRLGGDDAADVLVVQYETVDAARLDRLPSCRAVVRYGVGVDTIDVEAATVRGVWVVNVPDYGTTEVADHAAGELRRLSERTLGVGFEHQPPEGAERELAAHARVIATLPGVRASPSWRSRPSSRARRCA